MWEYFATVGINFYFCKKALYLMTTFHLPLRLPAHTQTGVNVLTVCALMVAAVWAFGTEGFGVACALSVAMLVPQWLYARMSRGERSGGELLAVVGALLAVWAFFNIYQWTAAVGRSLSEPQLVSDAVGYFRWAHNHYHDLPQDCDTKFTGFPLMIALSWTLLGQSIAWPIALNVMLTLLCIVLAGQMACRVLETRVAAGRERIALLTMGGTSVLFYFISHATLLLKEPLTYFAVALAALAIARMKQSAPKAKAWQDMAVFVGAIAILAIARTGVIYFIMAGVLLAFADCRKMWRYAFTLIGIALIGLGIGICFSNGFSTEVQMRIIAGAYNGGDIMSQVYQAQDAYTQFISQYHNMPVWQKMLLLPATCTVQIFIPFPWAGAEETSIATIATRFQWGWYAIAGIALFYLFVCSWRKHALGWWGVWPFICFAAAAFSAGGAVSRYALPYQPLMVVVAVWVVCQVRKSTWRRTFIAWSLAYAAVATTILAYCYTQTH